MTNEEAAKVVGEAQVRVAKALLLGVGDKDVRDPIKMAQLVADLDVLHQLYAKHLENLLAGKV